MAHGETYEEFVEKFKPKKTTDDCYTPPEIYEAVADYVVRRYGLFREEFVRPFWPGGDYENYEYTSGSVVVDNPPFSILAKVRRFYKQKGIHFFLFCPARRLVCRNELGKGQTQVCTGRHITFENGVRLGIDFVTDLEPGTAIRSDPELSSVLKDIDCELRNRSRQLEKHVKRIYAYPTEVCTSSMMDKYAQCGIELKICEDDIASRIERLDCGVKVFGGGIILRGRAAAANAAADKACALAAEKSKAVPCRLSDRELALVNQNQARKSVM